MMTTLSSSSSSSSGGEFFARAVDHPEDVVVGVVGDARAAPEVAAAAAAATTLTDFSGEGLERMDRAGVRRTVARHLALGSNKKKGGLPGEGGEEDLLSTYAVYDGSPSTAAAAAAAGENDAENRSSELALHQRAVVNKTLAKKPAVRDNNDDTNNNDNNNNNNNNSSDRRADGSGGHRESLSPSQQSASLLSSSSSSSMAASLSSSERENQHRSSDSGEASAAFESSETTGRLLQQLTQDDGLAPLERLRAAWGPEVHVRGVAAAETGSGEDLPPTDDISALHRAWAVTHIAATADHVLFGPPGSRQRQHGSSKARNLAAGTRAVCSRLLPLLLEEFEIQHCAEDSLRAELCAQLAGVARVVSGVGLNQRSSTPTPATSASAAGGAGTAMLGLDPMVADDRVGPGRGFEPFFATVGDDVVAPAPATSAATATDPARNSVLGAGDDEIRCARARPVSTSNDIFRNVRTHAERVTSARRGLAGLAAGSAVRTLAVSGVRGHVLPVLCALTRDRDDGVQDAARDALCEVVSLCLPSLFAATGESVIGGAQGAWTASPALAWIEEVIESAVASGDAVMALKCSAAAALCCVCAPEEPGKEAAIRNFVQTFVASADSISTASAVEGPDEGSSEDFMDVFDRQQEAEAVFASLVPRVAGTLAMYASCHHDQTRCSNTAAATAGSDTRSASSRASAVTCAAELIGVLLKRCTALTRERLFSTRLAGLTALAETAEVAGLYRPCHADAGEIKADSLRQLAINAAVDVTERAVSMAKNDAHGFAKLGAARFVAGRLFPLLQNGLGIASGSDERVARHLAYISADFIKLSVSLPPTRGKRISHGTFDALEHPSERAEVFCGQAGCGYMAAADATSADAVMAAFESASGLAQDPSGEFAERSPLEVSWQVRFAAIRALPDLAVAIVRQVLPDGPAAVGSSCALSPLRDTLCSFGGVSAARASCQLAAYIVSKHDSGQDSVRQRHMATLLEMLVQALTCDPVEEVRVRALNNAPTILASAVSCGLVEGDESFSLTVDALSSLAYARHWRYRAALATQIPTLVRIGAIAGDRKLAEESGISDGDGEPSEPPDWTTVKNFGSALFGLLRDEVHCVRKDAAEAFGPFLAEIVRHTASEVAGTRHGILPSRLSAAYAVECLKLSQSAEHRQRATFGAAVQSMLLLKQFEPDNSSARDFVGPLVAGLCSLVKDDVVAVRLSAARALSTSAPRFDSWHDDDVRAMARTALHSLQRDPAEDVRRTALGGSSRNSKEMT